jgi:amino acid transporter
MSIFPILHFSLMGLALTLCVSAVVTIRKKKGANWLKKHMLINIAGALSAVLGLLAMFYFKSSMGYPHFKSPHAIAGLVTLVILLAMPILGNLIMSGRQNLRKPHRILGRITVGLMSITAAFGALMIMTR